MSAMVRTALTQWLVALPLLLLLGPVAHAQTQQTKITAVVANAPPLVIIKDGQVTGFDIDLWNAIAEKLKWQTSYLTVPGVAGAYDAMRSKKADIVVAPAYYTTERDNEFDFSYSILNAGLLVMVRAAGESGVPNPLHDLISLIFSPALLVWLGIGLLMILVPAHIFWLLDRGDEDSLSPSKNYFPGIFQAMMWAATALVSQVQQLPAHRLARVLALVWMFVGVVFIALYTAELTANLTVQQIRGLINGPDDLPGKEVATVAGSVAVAELRTMGADVQEYPTVDEMFGALVAGKADAVVQSAPILRYYAAHDGAGTATTVGDEFHKQDIGFLFQLNSPLRRPVNAALIALHEDGTYEQLYNKWFGRP